MTVARDRGSVLIGTTNAHLAERLLSDLTKMYESWLRFHCCQPS